MSRSVEFVHALVYPLQAYSLADTFPHHHLAEECKVDRRKCGRYKSDFVSLASGSRRLHSGLVKDSRNLSPDKIGIAVFVFG